MKWKKYTITTTTQAEDYISSALSELGIDGVEIEDNVPLSAEDQKRMFIDILPELPKDEGIAKVSFYLEETEEDTKKASPELTQDTTQKTTQVSEQKTTQETAQKEKLAEVAKALEALRAVVPVGAGSITESETEDADWINNWKQFFKPFSVEDIYIHPSWEAGEPPKDCRCVIKIDPGTSFGTGKHETTQLCIRQLRKYIKEGDSVLDVGCGSGILSVASKKLGAKIVNGTDVDPVCMESVKENYKANNLQDDMGSFYCGNLIDDVSLQQQVGTECYDIVVANILADIIIPLTPAIPDRLKKGGIYITSGIIDFKEASVSEAIREAGFHILEINHMGEWVSITARKA